MSVRIPQSGGEVRTKNDSGPGLSVSGAMLTRSPVVAVQNSLEGGTFFFGNPDLYSAARTTWHRGGLERYLRVMTGHVWEID